MQTKIACNGFRESQEACMAKKWKENVKNNVQLRPKSIINKQSVPKAMKRYKIESP